MEKKKLKLSKVSWLIIFILLGITFLWCSFNIVKWVIDNKNTKNINNLLKDSIQIKTETVTNNNQKLTLYKIDFNELNTINKDTVAWVKVNDTNINYPVVQASDNDYYLTHSFNKKYSLAGWVFLDYHNDINTLDHNLIIYAHNRMDGSMFGTIPKLLTKDWFNNSNHLINITTPDTSYIYQIFSVYKIESENYYITPNFESDNEFKTFIDTIKSRSLYDFGIDVNNNDNILTLSTCSNQTTGRIAVHAKLIYNSSF